MNNKLLGYGNVICLISENKITKDVTPSCVTSYKRTGALFTYTDYTQNNFTIMDIISCIECFRTIINLKLLQSIRNRE